jgi:hypothetical protein
MTDILGVSAFYHDSAACLLRDGEIVATAQEERFTRKKRYAGFPREAVSGGGRRLKLRGEWDELCVRSPIGVADPAAGDAGGAAVSP